MWWVKINRRNTYPVFSEVVKARLSTFLGPLVESSFSQMVDIIDKESNRLNIDTYNARMTVEYNLNSKKSSDFYRWPDILRDPANKDLYYSIRTRKKDAVSPAVKVLISTFLCRYFAKPLPFNLLNCNETKVEINNQCYCYLT